MTGDLAAPDAPETAALLACLGTKADYLRLDIAEKGDWQAAERHLREKCGRLDILVQNAGMALIGELATLSPEDWNASMRINVSGAFLGFRALSTLLAETGANTQAGSSAITVSSILGIVGSAESVAYSTAKGALRMMTRALAIEFARARKPIRVNTLHPGLFELQCWNSISIGKWRRARWQGQPRRSKGWKRRRQWGGSPVPKKSPRQRCSWQPMTAAS